MTVTFVRYWGRQMTLADEVRHMRDFFGPAVANGWRNYLVCAQPPKEERWRAELAAIGVELVYIPRPPRNLHWDTIKSAFRLCRRLQPDIIHCDNIHTSPLIGAFLARVPVRVWFKRSMQPAYETMRTPTWKDTLAATVRASSFCATHVISVSQAVRDELVSLGIPKSKLLVFNNPVDRAMVQLIDPTCARAPLGYVDADVVIVTTGRAAPVKGWDTLLSAFARVAPRAPQAKLVFVGSTSEKGDSEVFANLQRVIKMRGLEGQVRFLGNVDDVGSILSAADIFVLPSRSEGNSNSLNEAFAVGLPCIATRVGNAPVLIQDGENGLLVERNNPQQLAEALALLIENSDRREQLAHRARQAMVGPTVAEYFNGLHAMYQCLVDQASGRRYDGQRTAEKFGEEGALQ
ncbi:MAG: glycosyltransferase [Candidatus Binatia bacterium]